MTPVGVTDSAVHVVVGVVVVWPQWLWSLRVGESRHVQVVT